MASNPSPNLLMILLGCTPKGRHTEQHDIFFTVGTDALSVKDQYYEFWADAGRIHVDCWRCVTEVDGYRIDVVPRKTPKGKRELTKQLFFLNLGGYKPGEFEEYHYKMLAVADSKAEAIKNAKSTAFFKHTGFKGAQSHIDDRYGIDVDDLFEVEDILPAPIRKTYRIRIVADSKKEADSWQIGYLKLPAR